MAGSTFDPDSPPFDGKRKTLQARYVRSLDSRDDTDADQPVSAGNEQTVWPGMDIDIRTDRIADADEAGIDYGPDEAEEDDRGLH